MTLENLKSREAGLLGNALPAKPVLLWHTYSINAQPSEQRRWWWWGRVG